MLRLLEDLEEVVVESLRYSSVLSNVVVLLTEFEQLESSSVVEFE